MRDGSRTLRPSITTGVRILPLASSQSIALTSGHSVTITTASAPRMASWGVGAIAMLTFAVAVNQLPVETQRMRASSAETATRAQKAETAAEEARLEARRFASALDTLNSDRDRLFARLSTLEQGLDSVTGSLSPQRTSPPAKPQPVVAAAAAPVPAPVEARPADTTAPTPTGPAASQDETGALVPRHQTVAPLRPVAPVLLMTPVSTATTLAEIARIADPAPAAADDALPAIPVRQTQFGVDLGGAASLPMLRNLWKTVRETHAADLGGLYPVVAIRERGRGAVQLRLVAGPIRDAAAAQRLCARVSDRIAGCETTVFEGQRLEFPPETRRPKILHAQPKAAVDG